VRENPDSPGAQPLAANYITMETELDDVAEENGEEDGEEAEVVIE
jgi:hypothetical protein